MPSVEFQTSSGITKYAYTISTPTSASASTIDSTLPTILFFHTEMVASEFWHPQFADPALRRFNLVATDMRGCGRTGGKVPTSFGQVEAAEDVIKFMTAINLPPCFMVGLSIGSVIATEVATRVPERVLGLFLMASMGTPETPDAIAGRYEIYECWTKGFESDPPNMDSLHESIAGTFQLGFSGFRSSVSEAMTRHLFQHALEKWSPPNIDTGFNAALAPVTNRTIQSDEDLARISCPVKLIHPEQDIAYSIEEVQTFYQRMLTAGVNVSLENVPAAPHFVSVTHSDFINDMLHDFVLENVNMEVPPSPSSAGTFSPWAATLEGYGWKTGSDDADSDFEEEYTISRL